MNNQDWERWNRRYVDKIKTQEDANVAIDSMIASLNDPYTQYLDREEYKEQVDVRKQIESIQKQIIILQKRIKAEKQFNRQMELNTEVRQLRKEITLLTDKLKKNNI